jgi:metal-responsive CopG/Arc/MetJ family transcriptional regulator
MEIIIPQTCLDGLMTGVSINLKPDLLTQIDAAKGTQSRSAFIVHAVFEYLNPTKADWEADRKQLIAQIEAIKSNEQRLENEVEYLRGEYSKINDALAQRLLTEATPRVGFWARLFGRKEETKREA